MQRHELIDQLKALKLYGMAGAFDETVTQGIRRQLTAQEILGHLCQAEAAERRARSIRYQMGSARFPVSKDLDSFRFTDSPVNEPLIRDVYGGGFLQRARNLIFIGGTGTGKTHLAIAIASHCVKMGKVHVSSVSLTWSINWSGKKSWANPTSLPAVSSEWNASCSMNWGICLFPRREVRCSST